MVDPTTTILRGQDLVLVPIVGTYVELRYIEHFSANESHHFEGMVCTHWSLLVENPLHKPWYQKIPTNGEGPICYTKSKPFNIGR